MEKPKINVSQPGPKSVPWLERATNSAQFRTFGFETTFSKANGIYLWDTDGNCYMTFSASAHHLGYCHPVLLDALKTQLDMTGVGRLRGIHPTLVEFSEKLLKIVPYPLSEGIVGFGNTGSDAGEFALHLARAYTGKTLVFAHLGAHHGFGVTSLSLTADRSIHRRFNPPLIPGVVHVPFPDCYRCIFGQEYPGCDLQCIEYVHHAFDTVAHPSETAAFYMEPIRSQGVVVPPDEYIPTLKEICEENEVIFIADEAMIGFGRTGKLWGVDHWDVKPDIMYMAKSVANGMAIAPLVSTKEIMQYDLIRGGTYAGSLPACACAIAHIDIMQQEKLVERSHQFGSYLLTRLNEFAETSPLIGDVRGRGLFIGIDFVKDQKSKKPATEEASRVVNELFQRGLMIGTSGVYGNVLRLLPPLIITKEEINTAITIIEDSINAVEKS